MGLSGPEQIPRIPYPTAVIACGFVSFRDKKTDLYTVNLDWMSEAPAVALKFGSDSPYPIGSRVLCMRTAPGSPPPTTWVILGRLDTAKSPDEYPKSPEDSLSARDQRLRDTAHERCDIMQASFRDPAEPEQYEGDAILSNRSTPRSYIRIPEGGDILSLATHACFTLLSKSQEAILCSARNLVSKIAGFLVSSQANPDKKQVTVDVAVTGDISKEGKADLVATLGAMGSAQRINKGVSEASKDQTLQYGVWSLFGEHALLEVDNKTKEIRLSKVEMSQGTDASSVTKQFRQNNDETAIEWGKSSIVVTEDEVGVTQDDNSVTMNKDAMTLKRGDHAVYFTDDVIALKWDADNYLVVNKNGVRMSGLVEIVGGNLRFPDKEQSDNEIPSGVADNMKPSLHFAIENQTLTMALGEELMLLNFENDFTVRNNALVDERFLTAYDNDMTTITAHMHNVPPVLTAVPSSNLGALDTPQSSSRKPTLTSATTSSTGSTGEESGSTGLTF